MLVLAFLKIDLFPDLFPAFVFDARQISMLSSSVIASLMGKSVF
jgi:hypothetical protein